MSTENSNGAGEPAEANGANPSPSAEGDAPPNATSSAAESTAAGPSAPPPADPLTQVMAERDRMRDQLARALADFDNYRKRSRRDQEEAVKRAREDILRELLPVFDNLERAADATRTASDVKAIADGVAMVIRLFSDTLTRLGGKRVESVGQPFDPNLHEAIQQVESDAHGAGIVASEMVPGYLFGDRLLRPAMVAVSKGPGPATSDAEPESESEGEEPN